MPDEEWYAAIQRNYGKSLQEMTNEELVENHEQLFPIDGYYYHALELFFWDELKRRGLK